MCERFKQDTGRTINEFITLVKVDEAKRMLRVTNNTIAQISDYLAFSSQSYFQNVFKKIEGCTPREYRGQRTSEKNIFK
jgi:AraC-like DNA-binding protein